LELAGDRRNGCGKGRALRLGLFLPFPARGHGARQGGQPVGVAPGHRGHQKRRIQPACAIHHRVGNPAFQGICILHLTRGNHLLQPVGIGKGAGREGR
jgi:hypothetical protein